ncbi:MAG: hypothetical protein M3O71_18810 [Bacteroidota bacterium]|nr:hypothetical protein [Bacteroidota bacterium]
MSRYAYFYKLNSREGKEHLYDDLISTAKFETSFSTYILDRAAECGKSFTITYSQVINSILNDFNEMRPSELWEIVGWYEQEVYGNDYRTNADREKNEQILGSMLKSSGIESLFDITSSTLSSYAFTNQI